MRIKKFSVLIAIFFILLPIAGCKEKQKTIRQEGKEKEPHIIFEPSKVNPKLTAGFVDIIEPEEVSINGTIHTGGWAYDPQKILPAKGVIIIANDKPLPISPQMGFKREDVAKAYRNDNLINSGWDTSIYATLLGKGKHRLEFYAVLKDDTFAPLEYRGKTYCEIEVVDKS
jgi:hypothetical protein